MYRVKLSKQGYQELLTLRGNPPPDSPGLTRNRGGVIGIGRDWVEVDETVYDIEAIKNDTLIRRDIDNPHRVLGEFKWFDVEYIGESEGKKPDDPKPTKKDLMDEVSEDIIFEDKLEDGRDRCMGVTGAGKQCSRPALEGEAFCASHK